MDDPHENDEQEVSEPSEADPGPPAVELIGESDPGPAEVDMIAGSGQRSEPQKNKE